ncbi:MAG: twin-arginine translocase TatA/TatE family subunit [Actinobacteria bacterium]|nr:twin-arginine translocase TatA/TatE family subunit [Actinomycetota bacterium]
MISILQGNEVLVISIVVLVLFGGSQLPKLARNLGSAQKEFKKAMDDAKSGQSSDESSNN